jgi:predicted secreted Zn-dependent protease
VAARRALLVLSLLAFAPAVGAAGDPDLRVVTVHHDYAIAGQTAAELRAAMNRRGPLDASRERFDAVTNWWINWYYRYGRSGTRCTIASADVRVRIVFTLPRWRPGPGAAPALVRKWNRYLQALRRHENGHSGHAVVEGKRILTGLRRLAPRPSCAQLGAAADALGHAEIRRGNAWDVAYDRRTGHGATQGAVFP